MTDPPSTPLPARLRDLLFRIIELAGHDGPDCARIQLVAHDALDLCDQLEGECACPRRADGWHLHGCLWACEACECEGNHKPRAKASICGGHYSAAVDLNERRLYLFERIVNGTLTLAEVHATTSALWNEEQEHKPWRSQLEAAAETTRLRQENDDLRARAIVAEHHKTLSLLGKSSYQDVVEDNLRTTLAETALRAEAAEARVQALEQERDELRAAFRDLSDAYNELLNAQIVASPGAPRTAPPEEQA